MSEKREMMIQAKRLTYRLMTAAYSERACRGTRLGRAWREDKLRAEQELLGLVGRLLSREGRGSSTKAG